MIWRRTEGESDLGILHYRNRGHTRIPSLLTVFKVVRHPVKRVLRHHLNKVVRQAVNKVLRQHTMSPRTMSTIWMCLYLTRVRSVTPRCSMSAAQCWRLLGPFSRYEHGPLTSRAAEMPLCPSLTLPRRALRRKCCCYSKLLGRWPTWTGNGPAQGSSPLTTTTRQRKTSGERALRQGSTTACCAGTSCRGISVLRHASQPCPNCGRAHTPCKVCFSCCPSCTPSSRLGASPSGVGENMLGRVRPSLCGLLTLGTHRRSR